MEVTTYETPREFYTAIGAPLGQREWQNALILGDYGLYCSPRPPRDTTKSSAASTEFKLLSSADPSGKICLVLAQTPSHPSMLVSSAVDPSNFPELDAHINALVDALGEACPREFHGDERLSQPLAAAVARRLGLRGVPVAKMRLNGVVLMADTLSASASTKHTLPAGHEIRRLQYPQDEKFREKVTDMYITMMAEFPASAAREIDRQAALANTDDTVEREHLWVYQVDGELAAITLCGRPTRTGMSVRNVYTSPQFRRNGYAERLVATLCRAHLTGEDGAKKVDHICLFFLQGLEGVTAGKIYERIGFGTGGEDRKYKTAHFDLKDPEKQGD